MSIKIAFASGEQTSVNTSEPMTLGSLLERLSSDPALQASLATEANAGQAPDVSRYLPVINNLVFDPADQQARNTELRGNEIVFFSANVVAG